MVAGLALIAAPFTAGVTAGALVGLGIGIGVGSAAASWQKYMALRPAENAAVRDELSLVAKGSADAAFVEAVMATVGVFLDVYSVGKGLTQATAVRRAAQQAELRGAMEAHEAAKQARLGNATRRTR